MDKMYLFKALEAECRLQVASRHLARQPRGVAATAQVSLHAICVPPKSLRLQYDDEYADQEQLQH